jgi:hypothetical protein
MRERRNAHTILDENLDGSYYLEDLGIDGRIILK